jgi:hypothetical protein
MKRYFKAFGYLLSVHVLALLVMTLFRLVEFIALHGMIVDAEASRVMAFVKGVWFDNFIACYISVLPVVKKGWVPESIFHGKHAIDNIAMLHALENNDLLIPCSIFMVITLEGVYLIFRALKKKNSGNIVSYTLATIVGLFLMLDSSLQPPVLNTKADKHLAPVIEKKFDTSKLYSYMSVDMLHFFSLNFYLGDKIQQFDKVLPQDGVLMIPEEDMPDFLEKFGKDYTFQKVWEVRKTVEWHNKVGFYRFVKTSANIALNK